MMCGMDISTRLDFAAAPDRVYAMMTDQAYLEEVCVASDSISYDASVSGSATHTSRTLPAPESAARFTGSQLTVIEDVTWSGPSSDASRIRTASCGGVPPKACSSSRSPRGPRWISPPRGASRACSSG